MGKHRILEDVQGPLTPAQVAQGMNAAARNARRLLADAQLLLDHRRYPSATSVAILSIEESSKISILRGMVGISDPAALKAGWKRYRDHRAKTGFWALIDLYIDGARKVYDFAPVVDRDAPHTATIDAIKQLGFYTGRFSETTWSEPENVVDERLASEAVMRARIFCPNSDVTEREVELWLAHVVPFSGTDRHTEGLLDWAAAMNREGLSSRTREEFEEFIVGEGFKPKAPGKQKKTDVG